MTTEIQHLLNVQRKTIRKGLIDAARLTSPPLPNDTFEDLVSDLRNANEAVHRIAAVLGVSLEGKPQ